MNISVERRIMHLLGATGWSRNMLGRKLGVSMGTVNKWWLLDRSPSPLVMRRLNLIERRAYRMLELRKRVRPEKNPKA